MTQGRRFDLVPHTHWDREWYLTEEGFRERLIPTLDLVLDLLTNDPGWRHFHLDGQTAMVDDYLSIRPERTDDVRKLVTDGRLSCGPWITLVDQFLVSGESIIRNLEDGIARARELGAERWVGYLPDQFGHIGQMPQILRTAGIDAAIVWRGVPGSIDRASFTWSAPDGSTVTAVYLPFGYGQGRALEPEELATRLDAEEERLDPFAAPDEPLLLTVGDDHEMPARGLSGAVAGLGEGRARISSLLEHIDSLGVPDLDWRGEMRSAARANLLPNTYSVRPRQKLERARAEHLLERYAEPLAALVPGFTWPEERLREAWRLLHLNGAHDSVCGCSTDEVAAAVDARTHRVATIASAVASEALSTLASNVEGAGPLLFNPSPFERNGIAGLGYGRGLQPRRAPAAVECRGPDLIVDGLELRFEDLDDAGDLYNFEPASEPRWGLPLPGPDPKTLVTGDGWGMEVAAESDPTEAFSVLHLTIDNRRPDHRLRILLRLPHDAEGSRAGAPFEIVERPVCGEGGPGEIASPWWPARGFVTAGGSGFLSEGVIEYEVIPPRTLAVTLMRCTSTISRPHALSTRRRPAGPDVATPGGQLLGSTQLTLGLLRDTHGASIVQVWEQFALPLLASDTPGSGGGPRGLLDVAVPALSSVRKSAGGVEVRMFNPVDSEQPYRVGSIAGTIRPFRIETVLSEGPG